MSRTLTVLALTAAALVAFGLYQLAYEVQRLQDELADLNRALVQDRQTIDVLRAEWSYMTRPEAIQDKALRNLDLIPLAPQAVIGVAELPRPQDRIVAAPEPEPVRASKPRKTP